MFTVKKILVPLDGSDNSFRALDVAIFLAKKSNATLVGFYSLNPMPMVETHMVDPLHCQFEEKKYANQVLDKVKSICVQNNVDFTKIVDFGAPGYAIIRFIKNKDNKIDLVVMGSRGSSVLKEVFLGSVSNFVLHKSPTPVLIVK